MKNYIVVIGASAGGLDALKNLLKDLPKEFNAPIFIVMHISPYTKSRLPDILQRYTHLNVIVPQNDQPIQNGEIYIAPSNLHLLLNNDKISLHQGPKVNHNRPAIDPLFFSAASHYGHCAIGIIMSGLLDDGSAGLLAIKRNKGIAIVQDPEEADYPDMPLNALKHVSTDYCLRTQEIGKILHQITSKPLVEECQTKNDLLEQEIKMNTVEESFSEEDMNSIGKPSVFACPDCYGVLWEINDKDILRFRCRVGHAFTQASLQAAINNQVEEALWMALKALEEKENLAKKVAEKVAFNNPESAQVFNQKVKNYEKHINTLRSILNDQGP